MLNSLVFTERYTHFAQRFLMRLPDVVCDHTKTLALLKAHAHHPALRVQPLGGRLAVVHSESINRSYRITLQLLVTEREVGPIFGQLRRGVLTELILRLRFFRRLHEVGDLTSRRTKVMNQAA